MRHCHEVRRSPKQRRMLWILGWLVGPGWGLVVLVVQLFSRFECCDVRLLGSDIGLGTLCCHVLPVELIFIACPPSSTGTPCSGIITCHDVLTVLHSNILGVCWEGLWLVIFVVILTTKQF